jgi:hypothetical protein
MLRIYAQTDGKQEGAKREWTFLRTRLVSRSEEFSVRYGRRSLFGHSCILLNIYERGIVF